MKNNPLNSLPHSHPFRFVDKILELNAQKGVAIKNVTGDESFLQGHFKENPIMPGVLIVEAMAQVAGLVMNYEKMEGAAAFLAQIKDIKFKKPIRPGDQIRIIAEVKERFSTLASFSVKALVDGTIAAEGEIIMAEMKRAG